MTLPRFDWLLTTHGAVRHLVDRSAAEANPNATRALCGAHPMASSTAWTLRRRAVHDCERCAERRRQIERDELAKTLNGS